VLHYREVAMKKLLILPAVLLLLCLQPSAADAQFRRGFVRPARIRPYPYPPPWVVIPMMQMAEQNNAYQVASYPPAASADPLPAPKENRAVIHILLPSTANNIWVDGVKMPTRSTDARVFISPPIEPGHDYTYTVRADWPSGLNMVSQERTVVVRANGTSTVDFNQPASAKSEALQQ
jgi:uncharacterized protein (TIGR03000 family)